MAGASGPPYRGRMNPPTDNRETVLREMLAKRLDQDQPDMDPDARAALLDAAVEHWRNAPETHG